MTHRRLSSLGISHIHKLQKKKSHAKIYSVLTTVKYHFLDLFKAQSKEFVRTLFHEAFRYRNESGKSWIICCGLPLSPAITHILRISGNVSFGFKIKFDACPWENGIVV